jgi:hypothetical protein
MYPRSGIDKPRKLGESWAVDPELRDALNQLTADLRGEIRSGDVETRAYVDTSIQASAAETRAYIDERVGTSAAETRAYIDERVGTSAADTRRHFDVVGESLRGDIRVLAEAMALNKEGTERRFGEEAGRTDRLEGRVLRLEARVTILEDDRKPPRRPRQQ